MILTADCAATVASSSQASLILFSARVAQDADAVPSMADPLDEDDDVPDMAEFETTDEEAPDLVHPKSLNLERDWVVGQRLCRNHTPSRGPQQRLRIHRYV